MITAIIQCRRGSTRLPDKIIKEVCGKPILWHQIERMKQSRLIERIVLATTVSEDDSLLEDLGRHWGVDVFRGSEEDVLERFYQAALKFKGETIVRIPGDCPLIDPKVVDKVIDAYIKNFPGYDYVSNTIKPTYPDGQDTEVFSFKALEKTWREAKKDFEREHVTPYLYRSGRFRTFNIRNDIDYSDLRWTLDEEQDLKFIREVYKRLYKEEGIFYMEDVIRLLKEEPSIMKINKGMARNEKFVKQLQEDQDKGAQR